MTRLNLLLLLSVLASALYLVNLQYQSRWLYSEWDKAQSQAHHLAAEIERLQVEKRAQATSARVEKIAKSQLQMRAANPSVTTYVSYTTAAASQAATSAPAVASAATSGAQP